MTYFRILLTTILVSISIYTAIVVSNHGLNLLPIFFGDIAKMTWPGQFNFDFMCFLTLSASWVMWRNKFTPKAIALGVVAFFGGALFLSIYLLVLSKKHNQNVGKILMGERA